MVGGLALGEGAKSGGRCVCVCVCVCVLRGGGGGGGGGVPELMIHNRLGPTMKASRKRTAPLCAVAREIRIGSIDHGRRGDRRPA